MFMVYLSSRMILLEYFSHSDFCSLSWRRFLVSCSYILVVSWNQMHVLRCQDVSFRTFLYKGQVELNEKLNHKRSSNISKKEKEI